MDKSAFKIQTFEQADHQQLYWQTKSLEERLEAAMEMTKAAYKIAQTGFAPMEKVLASCKKRNG